jgi:hypothetical protein
MSRIYEALRRAEGSPVDKDKEIADEGQTARGGAQRVTLEAYPRETPVQPEPHAPAPAARQDRPAPLKTDRADPLLPSHPPLSEVPPPIRADRPGLEALPKPSVWEAPPQADRHAAPAASVAVRHEPEPALPEWTELIAPETPLRIDRAVTMQDGEGHDTPAPLAQALRVTPATEDDSTARTMPAMRRAPSPAPAAPHRSGQPATPAPRTDRPVPPAPLPAAPAAAERSAALQAARQSRSVPAPTDRPAPRSEHPLAEGPASIWNSSVEGITSKAQRVDRSKGRWLRSLFK